MFLFAFTPDSLRCESNGDLSLKYIQSIVSISLKSHQFTDQSSSIASLVYSSNCTYTHKLRWKHDWRNWRRLILDWLYPSQRLNTTNLLCTKLRAMFSNLAAYRVSPEQYIDSSVIQNQFYRMFLESILQIVDQDISQQHVLDEFGMPRRVCEAFSWSNLVNELKLHQIASML